MTSQAVQKAAPRDTVRAFLEGQKEQFQVALPKHMDPDRFLRIVLTEVRKNPALERCDPKSFIAAVIQSAQLGLEVGSGLGYAYLIPYGTTCQLVIGYKGLIDLARRSGQLLSISAHCVHEKDYFDYELGDEERIVHKPAVGERGAITAVYAIAKLKDGGIQREVMSIDEVERIRKGSKNGNGSVWKDHYGEMVRKTAIRRIAKYLPLSPDMRDAIDAEDENEHQPPIQVNPQRFAEISALPDAPLAHEDEAEKKLAVQDLTQAWTAGIAKGIDVHRVIGRTLKEASDELSTDQIFHAMDQIRAATEEKA